jgi:hypothetical protein
MLDVDFWLEQADKFTARALQTKDPQLHQELEELAAVCEAVAEKIAEHAPSG